MNTETYPRPEQIPTTAPPRQRDALRAWVQLARAHAKFVHRIVRCSAATG